MTARPKNTSTCVAVAPRRATPRRRRRLRRLALAATAALSGLLAACGASGQSADSLLRATFAPHKPITSGQVDLSLALTPHPAGAAGAPGSFSLRLAGPFTGTGAGRVPDFALALALRAAGQAREAVVVWGAGRLYLTLGGVSFLAPTEAAAALEQGYAQGGGGRAAGAGRPAFAPLGIEPGAWLTRASRAGSVRIAGADTIHIVAGLDGPRFLADARRLASSGEALAGARARSTAALSGAVRSGRVDLYTGARDHLLRRLALTAELSSGETVTFELRFAQLNRPQAIAVPARARPPSALGPALERLGFTRGAAPR